MPCVKCSIIFLSLLAGIICISACSRLDTFYSPPPLVSPYVTSSEVTAIRQMWGEGPWGGVHSGIDFSGTAEAGFRAVAAGTITKIEKHWIPKSLWTVEMELQINPFSTILYVWEPYNITDEADIAPQIERLVVKVGDVVETGQLLGRLYVPGSEFPHLHLGIMQGSSFTDPLPYFKKEAQEEILSIYNQTYK